MSRKQVKVLLLENIPDSALSVLAKENNYEVEIVREALSEAQLAKKVSDANVIGIGTQRSEVLTDEVIRSAHKLLAIGCFSNDISSVDVKCASEMGIPVFHSPYGASHSKAELIMSQIILLARQLGDRNREMNLGNWQKKSNDCFEIRGKVLGIVGYGHIGSQLGVMGEFFGMKVNWYDPLPLMPIGNSIPANSLEELLKVADFLCVCVPNLQSNVNLISEAQIKLMKKGSYIISSSFDQAVDVDAVISALKSKHLYGAAIDSFPQGDSPKDTSFLSKFKDTPNLIISPRIGDMTQDSLVRIGIEVSTYLDRFITEGCTQGSVNFPVMETRPVPVGKRRILNIHKNVRGVVQELNGILQGFNIGKQMLDTKDNLGYAIIDLDSKEIPGEIISDLALLSNSVKTRTL